MNSDLNDSEFALHWVFVYLNNITHVLHARNMFVRCSTCDHMFFESIEFNIACIVEFEQLFDIVFSFCQTLCTIMLMKIERLRKFLSCGKKKIRFG